MEPRYLRMIRGMKKGRERAWSVYILRCGDGSLYTGIAKDVTARLAKHAAGKGAAYTRTHLPVQLLYREDAYTRSEALVREAAIKTFPRPKKEALAAGSIRSSARSRERRPARGTGRKPDAAARPRRRPAGDSR